jgi:dienelactone hydrolase
LANAESVVEKQIAATVLDAKVEWLETSDKEKFLSVYEDSDDKDISGAILIVPDQYSNANERQLMQPLRKMLGKQHWRSLTISPMPAPEKVDLKPLSSEELDKQKDDFLKKYNEEATQKSMNARIDAAVAHLQKNANGVVLILGEGSGAMQVAMYVASHSSADFKGIIMLAPYLFDARNELFTAEISKITQPILLLYGVQDYPIIQTYVKVVNAAAKKNPELQLEVKKIKFGHYDTPSNFPQLSRHILAWINDKQGIAIQVTNPPDNISIGTR